MNVVYLVIWFDDYNKAFNISDSVFFITKEEAQIYCDEKNKENKIDFENTESGYYIKEVKKG